jgi:hypothetical protein
VNRAQLQALHHRIDALRRKCSTGYSCGSSCISIRKECRTSPGSSIGKQRLKRLLALAAGEKVPQRGIAPVRAQEAAGLAAGIGQQRSARAGQLRGERQQQAAAKEDDGLIPTALPFTPEVAARIRKGIVERTMRSGAVAYGGEELAEAFLKVAQSPGGENARKALAFMEEAGIMANVAAESKEEIERITGKPSSELPWTRPMELAKVVREVGLVSDERLEWLRKDQTEAGQAVLRRAEIVRNPPKPSAEEKAYKKNYEQAKTDYKKAEEDFDRGVSQGWRFPEDKKSALWSAKNSLDNDRRRYFAHRDGRLNQIKWAAQDFISGEMSGFAGRENGGYYQFGQKKYVAVSGDTNKTFAGVYKVDAAETDLANMRKHYSSHIDRHLPEKLAGLADIYDNFDMLHSPLGFSGKQTYAEKALGIHIHELGHAVDSFADVRVREIPETVATKGQRVLSHKKHSWSARHDNRPDAIKKALKEKRGPSNYALTNDGELFAESFASWVIAPRALKRHHPDLYAWVEDRFSQARTTMARNTGLKFVEER